ncbi:MAG: MBL fold metallo-hydrolase [Gemmatimonadetes bacterium]|nr:MBL fold metallo-hydrolase [Gemmatimonadota bacterium]NIO32135.1 MBL fold metallo-hydrolase [Gemmatimonadota bacterium]
MKAPRLYSRREFIGTSLTCAGHLGLMALPFSPSVRRLWSSRTRGQIVAQEPFARLEEIGEGLFALISTPLGGDYTTVSNGGIIVGGDGVLVVEGFMSSEGARWLAEKARELSGRWPTHAVITHYHSDHSRGLDGYYSEGGGPDAHATPVTRELVLTRRGEPADDRTQRLWADVTLLDEEEPSLIDLGGRTVAVVPRSGHTPSDVTIELTEGSTAWCGDLVWNGMFPNYVDATPTILSEAVRAIRSGAWSTYVPGHGPLADGADMEKYVAVLDDIEDAARRAFEDGASAEEAGAGYEIPAELGEWTLFNPQYFQRAIGAWMRELDASG